MELAEQIHVHRLVGEATGGHLVEQPPQRLGDQIGDLVVGLRAEQCLELAGAAGIDRLRRLTHRPPLLRGSVRARSV